MLGVEVRLGNWELSYWQSSGRDSNFDGGGKGNFEVGDSLDGDGGGGGGEGGKVNLDKKKMSYIIKWVGSSLNWVI